LFTFGAGCAVIIPVAVSVDNGYIEIYSAGNTFAALKANGTITAWGGSANAPTDSGYTKIYSNISGFADHPKLRLYHLL
jgi:hypothetical protein